MLLEVMLLEKSGVVAAGSLPGFCTCLSWIVAGFMYSTGHDLPPVEQRGVCYYQCMNATSVPLGMSSHAGAVVVPRCHSWIGLVVDPFHWQLA